MTRRLLAASLLLIACAPALAGPGPDYSIRLSRPDDPRAAFELVGLDPGNRDALAPGLDRERGASILAVTVKSETADPPTILGSYRIVGDALQFQPRFPIDRGLTYRAVFNPTALPYPAKLAPIVAEFTLPRPKPSPTTRVERVFPSRALIPDNQLKLYVQFSAPMSRGDIYRRIRLLDESGRAVDLPFLEIDEELWDPNGKRLTLLFDPGRIKTGLRPRLEAGPILRPGHSYTLVIDRELLDAAGNPLVEPFRKTYRVGPADGTPPDPSAWTIRPPRAGTRDPIRVAFPEPLDRALLARSLAVLDDGGRPVPGDVAIEAEETAWTLNPGRPWEPGEYRIAIDPDLEDLAGNRIGRPFEVDVFEPARDARSPEVRFRVSSPGR